MLFVFVEKEPNITKGATVFIVLLVSVMVLAIFHRCKAGDKNISVKALI